MEAQNLRSLIWLALCCAPLLAGLAREADGKTSMKPVGRSKLCITEGEIEQREDNKLSVSVPKMRAFVTGPTLQEVEAHFTYLGPSKKSSPLASGELRRQFGLKLRAQDGCNLVYAMWRIEPKTELVVSVKSNPGLTQSSECDAHGYHNIKPTQASQLPDVKRGHRYTLRAIIDGSRMRVYANNNLVWEGDLGSDVKSINGPVGVRTDNGRFDFELFAAEPQPGQQGASASCRKGSGEE
ncbi:MAG TPA: hypothetical protein VKD65_00790 [Candidatus Angelobacter sp.]|nr:hypothetical protein [Candidatus Angelobacter sp.]